MPTLRDTLPRLIKMGRGRADKRDVETPSWEGLAEHARAAPRWHHGTPKVCHMTDWGTVLLLIPSAPFSRAMLALVLWPIFAGDRG